MTDRGHEVPDGAAAAARGDANQAALSRRRLLTGAGAAVAGGVALAAAGPAGVAEAASTSDAVGIAPEDSTAVEFRGRITQSGASGQTFSSVGYLIAVRGLNRADLFAGSTQNETTALLTVSSSGELVARVLDQSVHALDIKGTLTVYQRSAPGASFDNPASFAVGRPVARFQLTLQDVLTVFATAQGIPTLTGDMLQTEAQRLSGPLSGRFGEVGSRSRMLATGLGHLVDPVTLNAELEIAGNWTTEGR
jgi:hypothetical protein